MDGGRPAAGDTFGCHRLLRELGRGATATVFEAVHEELARRVAVKLLDPALANDEAVRARFRREGSGGGPRTPSPCGRGLRRRDRPFAVPRPRAGHGGHAGGPPRRRRTVDERGRDPAVPPIVSALQHIHAAGIVHRDLKPANVLLTEDLHGHLVPKVSDFGISKIEATDALTRDHAVLGTIGYMAPEQLRAAARVDGAADRWALGVMLLESVTGKTAFPGETTAQRIRAVLEDVPVGLDTVQGPMRDVLTTLLSRSPRERFDGDVELGLALARIAGDEGWRDTFQGLVAAGPGATLDEVQDLAGNSAASVVTTAKGGRTRWALLLGVAIVALAGLVLQRRGRVSAPPTPSPGRSVASGASSPTVRSVASSPAVTPSSTSTSLAVGSAGAKEVSPPASTTTTAPPAQTPAAGPPPTPKPFVAAPVAKFAAAAASSTQPATPAPAAPAATGALGAPILE